MNAGQTQPYSRCDESHPLRQGEILSDVAEFPLAPESVDSIARSIGQGELAEQPKVNLVRHPFAAILTQDCDLEQDFKSRQRLPGMKSDDDDRPKVVDKLLPTVLLCQVFRADELRGNRAVNSKIWEWIKVNQHPRYQFLQKTDAAFDLLGEGLPEMGIDFKRYFCIPTEVLYAQVGSGICRRRSRLISPYLEHLSSRFADFLSRVGLPVDHLSDPVV